MDGNYQQVGCNYKIHRIYKFLASFLDTLYLNINKVEFNNIFGAEKLCDEVQFPQLYEKKFLHFTSLAFLS